MFRCKYYSVWNPEEFPALEKMWWFKECLFEGRGRYFYQPAPLSSVVCYQYKNLALIYNTPGGIQKNDN